jgi:hypothetical protein
MNWRAARLQARIRRQGSENVHHFPNPIAPLVADLAQPLMQVSAPTKDELRRQSVLAVAQWREAREQ